MFTSPLTISLSSYLFRFPVFPPLTSPASSFFPYHLIHSPLNPTLIHFPSTSLFLSFPLFLPSSSSSSPEPTKRIFTPPYSLSFPSVSPGGHDRTLIKRVNEIAGSISLIISGNRREPSIQRRGSREKDIGLGGEFTARRGETEGARVMERHLGGEISPAEPERQGS